MNKHILILAIILISLFSSCTAPKFCNQKSREHLFTCYHDSIVFTYNTTIIYKLDTELIYPIPFSFTLPVGVHDYYYMNSEEFGFIYKYNQLILLNIDLSTSVNKPQNQFYPTKKEVDSILYDTYPDSKMYDFPVNYNKRENLVIQKDNFTILLCNIKKKNLTKFSSLITIRKQ